MDMKSPPYQPAYTEQQDAEHLQLLSIFYYVMAGMAALGGLLPAIYILFGLAMMGGAAAGSGIGADERTGLAVVGGMFTAFGLAIVAVVCVMAFCLFLTGRYLTQYRNRTFCFIIAGLLCLNFPLGAVLGVFTFIVLSRESVRARFEANPFGNSMPPPGSSFSKF
jgi:hypothetical protein